RRSTPACSTRCTRARSPTCRMERVRAAFCRDMKIASVLLLLSLARVAAAEPRPEIGASAKHERTLGEANPSTGEPADFIADAKLLYRIAACGNEATPVDDKIEKI